MFRITLALVSLQGIRYTHIQIMLIFAFLTVVTLCGLSNCQRLYVPSDAELEELLSDRSRVTETIDCVIKYDPGTCDHRLKDAFELAPEYFATNGKCRDCTADALRRVKNFLQRLQKQYRKEYQRLILAVT